MKIRPVLLGLALAQPLAAATLIHDEAVDGDLSDNGSAPTVLSFGAGITEVAGSVQGDSFGRDVDFFTFNIASGLELTAITLSAYDAGDNLAFVGIDDAATTDVIFQAPSETVLIGGTVFGGDDIGDNLLPSALSLFLSLPPSSGPLGEGDYTIWVNQTGDPSAYTLAFNVVPEPTTGTLALAAGCLLLLRRQRAHKR